MSNENFPNQAVETLTRGIHDPCFFSKLASDWNIKARSDDEANQLLEIAVLLRGTQEESIKTASSRGNEFLSGALDSLKGALGDRGYNPGLNSAEQGIKQAAYQASHDPQIAQAALAYAQHLFAAQQ
jgi:hypothetical protein